MSGNSFRVIAPTLVRSQSFSFLSVGTLKPSSVINVDWKWRLHQRNFYACHTLHISPTSFEMERQSIIIRVYTCTDSSGGHLGRVLRIVTWWTVRSQQLLNWVGVL